MRLHKMVNGKQVLLTEIEEAELRAEWERNRVQAEVDRKRQKQRDETKAQLKTKFAQMMGFTIEEVELLMER